MEVSRFTEIATSPDKVWSFLVEPEKILKWCLTFRKFQYTGEQREGPGTTFYVEEKAAGSTMKLNFTVSEWVKDKKLAFKMTSGTGVKSYEQIWSLELIPAGTKFIFFEKVELPFGIIGKLIGKLMRGNSERHVKKMLRTLKRIAIA